MEKKKLINKGRVVINYSDEDMWITMTPMMRDAKLRKLFQSVDSAVEKKQYRPQPVLAPRGKDAKRNRRIQMRQG